MTYPFAFAHVTWEPGTKSLRSLNLASETAGSYRNKTTDVTTIGNKGVDVQKLMLTILA